MTRFRYILMSVPALALSLGSLPASAARALDADDAALCSAAMDLARDRVAVSFSDQAKFIRASDWFTARGVALNEAWFTEQLEIYTDALTEARDNGDPQFATTVNGCETYFDTSRTV